MMQVGVAFLQNFSGGEAEDIHWGLWGAQHDAYCQEQPPIHELAYLVKIIDSKTQIISVDLCG